MGIKVVVNLPVNRIAYTELIMRRVEQDGGGGG